MTAAGGLQQKWQHFLHFTCCYREAKSAEVGRRFAAVKFWRFMERISFHSRAGTKPKDREWIVRI